MAAKKKNPRPKLIPAKVLIGRGGKMRVFVSAAAVRRLKANPAPVYFNQWDVLYTDDKGNTRIYTMSDNARKAKTDAAQARKRGYKKVRVKKMRYKETR